MAHQLDGDIQPDYGDPEWLEADLSEPRRPNDEEPEEKEEEADDA